MHVAWGERGRRRRQNCPNCHSAGIPWEAREGKRIVKTSEGALMAGMLTTRMVNL